MKIAGNMNNYKREVKNSLVGRHWIIIIIVYSNLRESNDIKWVYTKEYIGQENIEVNERIIKVAHEYSRKENKIETSEHRL